MNTKEIIKAAILSDLESQSEGQLYFHHEEGKYTTVDGFVDIDSLVVAIIVELKIYGIGLGDNA